MQPPTSFMAIFILKFCVYLSNIMLFEIEVGTPNVDASGVGPGGDVTNRSQSLRGPMGGAFFCLFVYLIIIIMLRVIIKFYSSEFPV